VLGGARHEAKLEDIAIRPLSEVQRPKDAGQSKDGNQKAVSESRSNVFFSACSKSAEEEFLSLPNSQRVAKKKVSEEWTNLL